MYQSLATCHQPVGYIGGDRCEIMGNNDITVFITSVSSATDVMKAAASLVLTQPGLTDVVNAVEASRRIYQRTLTYALNKIIKTLRWPRS